MSDSLPLKPCWFIGSRLRLPVCCCAILFGSLLIAFGVLGCQAPPLKPSPTTAPSFELAQLSQDVHFLAAPEQEGRGIGSVGQARAGAMIETRLRALHLQPAFPDGSFRQVFVSAATLPASTQPVSMFNVVAERVGSKPDECIVVGAHYDHLGYGGRGSVVPWSHAIHPGADDNASGTAAVLALARRIAQGAKPARTIVFVLFAGEERGLLGSDWFVRHPPMPLPHIVAMMNFDMVGHLRNNDLYIGGEKTAVGFDQLVRQAKRDTGLELKVFSLGGGGPSDHRAFSEKRIPVLFFFTGLHADYHTPRDLADSVNFEGLETIVTFAAHCVERLERVKHPAYQDGHDGDATVLSPVWLRPHARLGVEIDATDHTGVRVSRVFADSAGEQAGLKVGDLIVEADHAVVHSFQELSDRINAAMPGDESRLTIQRDGKTRRVDAYLGEQKEKS